MGFGETANKIFVYFLIFWFRRLMN